MSADDDGGEYAEDYPDMKSQPFDEALETFVLDWFNKHVEQPRFFTVEGEEEFVIT